MHTHWQNLAISVHASPVKKHVKKPPATGRWSASRQVSQYLRTEQSPPPHRHVALAWKHPARPSPARDLPAPKPQLPPTRQRGDAPAQKELTRSVVQQHIPFDVCIKIIIAGGCKMGFLLCLVLARMIAYEGKRRALGGYYC